MGNSPKQLAKKKKNPKKETEKGQRSLIMLQDDVLLLATQFLPGHLTASQTCCSKSCLCYLILFQDVSSVGEWKFLSFFLVPLMTRLTKPAWQLWCDHCLVKMAQILFFIKYHCADLYSVQKYWVEKSTFPKLFHNCNGAAVFQQTFSSNVDFYSGYINRDHPLNHDHLPTPSSLPFLQQIQSAKLSESVSLFSSTQFHLKFPKITILYNKADPSGTIGTRNFYKPAVWR